MTQLPTPPTHVIPPSSRIYLLLLSLDCSICGCFLIAPMVCNICWLRVARGTLAACPQPCLMSQWYIDKWLTDWRTCHLLLVMFSSDHIKLMIPCQSQYVICLPQGLYCVVLRDHYVLISSYCPRPEGFSITSSIISAFSDLGLKRKLNTILFGGSFNFRCLSLTFIKLIASFISPNLGILTKYWRYPRLSIIFR